MINKIINNNETYYIMMILIMMITILALHVKMKQIKDICEQQISEQYN